MTLIHAFVTSKLENCNSILYGLPKYAIKKLQSVQNAAARLITLSKKHDHITPLLINLHWLPIEERIKYKIFLVVFKCLHGVTPSYIDDLITIYKPVRNLRSSSELLLTSKSYKLKSYGLRFFFFLLLLHTFGITYRHLFKPLTAWPLSNQNLKLTSLNQPLICKYFSVISVFIFFFVSA